MKESERECDINVTTSHHFEHIKYEIIAMTIAAFYTREETSWQGIEQKTLVSKAELRGNR